MASASDLPTGVVTFLLTDVEASTRLWRESAEAAAAITRHAALIASAVARHGGIQPVEQGEGDSTVSTFARASDALAAALDAQRALRAETWPGGIALRVRMAVHTGEAEVRAPGLYGGAAIIRCARIRAVAAGGQVLVSSATREVLGDVLPDGMTLADVATVRLAGFDRTEHVYQLCHPDLPADFTPIRARRTSGLQAWPTGLVGRTAEREQIAALLERARICTITGAGGAGKTRLAHAVAEDVGERFPDGVVWVELSRLSEDVQVAGTVAAACGVQEAPGVPVFDLLAQVLAEARLLVVLDNCEHLLDGSARVAEALVRGGSGPRVLVTSREPLGAAGETVWRIPPLALPPAGEADPSRLSAFDAVQLFVERAAATEPGFRLDADTAPAVAHICQRLDGLPLALELAAARVRTLSVRRLADGLDDRFRLLTGGPRTAVARQRTLLASVEWSHGLLDESERLLFRRLGVFAAPFTVEAAEAVAADDDVDRFEVCDLLARLVDKSLVQLSGDRHRLLETLRHYALERASEADELTVLRSRHLAWFRRRAAGWDVGRRMTRVPVLDEIGAEAPDLLTALDWSLQTENEATVELLHALATWLGQRGAHEELRALARQVLAPVAEGSAAWVERLAPLATHLFFAADVTWMPAAKRALDADPPVGSTAARGYVLHALSFGPSFSGRHEALAALEQVAEMGRTAGNEHLEGISLLTLASTVAFQGDRARLGPLLAWLDRHVPADACMRFLLDNAHAWAAAFDGRFDVVRDRVAPYLDGVCPFAIATQAGLVGLWTEDAALVERAIRAAERNTFTGAFASSVCWLRAVRPLLAGDLDEARRLLDVDPAPWLMMSASASLRLMAAELALAQSDEARAAALLDEVEPRVTDTAFQRYASVIHLLRAEWLRRRGEVRDAEARAHAALEVAAEHGMHVVTVESLEMLAILADSVHDAAHAAPLLGATVAFRERTGFRWLHPYRRDTLAALHGRLRATIDESRAISLADAVALARRGRGERRRPDTGWDSLTPTELKVVEQVAAGLPNREIAKKLFVSLATVKTHLIHVYTKLDVRSRTELASAATSRTITRRDAGPTERRKP
jgi:predicted ATPase/class 3 adenylate cyclase/DNA-binding CsgD family transcriptional regulator